MTADPAPLPLRRRPRGVIFDMDGTLLDTEAVHRAAMREAAGGLGLDFPDTLSLIWSVFIAKPIA